MKNKKLNLKTVLVSTLAAAAVVTPVLASCAKHDKEPEVETKYFEIVDGELKGFKPGLTDEQKKEACKGGVLKLPAVKTIATNAFAADMFRDAPFATEIVIDASTETIGERAFFSNQASKITWNDGVEASKLTHIGRSAFAFCKNLASFEMPAGLLKTSTTDIIEDGAFFSCSALKMIDLSLGSAAEVNLPKWSSGAFRGIPTEGNVVFGTSEPKTDYEKVVKGNLWSRLVYAGVHPEKWPESYMDTKTKKPVAWKNPIKVVPTEYLTTNGGELTGYNTRMWKGEEFDTVIAFNSAITSLAADLMGSAKFGPKKLKYFVLIDTKVTAVPNDFCKDYTTTTQIYWPETLDTFGDSAFENSAVTNIFTSLAKIKAIGANAFKNCQTITEFTFANKDVTVGNGAFASAKKLELLDFSTYGSAKPEWTGTDIFDGTGTGTEKVNTIKINVPSTNPVDIWRLRRNLQEFLTTQKLPIEPSGQTKNQWHFDPAGWFSNIDQLLDIDENGILRGWAKDSNGVPMTKTEVTDALEELKFNGTWNLPASCIGVAEGAFAKQKEDKTWESLLPETIKTINFKSVIGIGANAFRNAPKLENIALYKACKGVGESAFEDCTLLHIIRIAELNWEKINDFQVGKNAFKNVGTADLPGGEKREIRNTKYVNQFDQWHYNYVVKSKFGLPFTGDKPWTFQNNDSATLVSMDENKVITGLVQAKETGPVTDELLVLLAKDKYGTDKIKFVIPSDAVGVAESAFISTEESTIPSAFQVIDFSQATACKSIGNYAFFHCGGKNAKMEVNFVGANQLSSIGEHAFGLSNFEGTVSIPASIRSIGEGAFYENKITTLVIPNFGTLAEADKIIFGNGCFAGNNTLVNINVSAYETKDAWDAVVSHFVWNETILDSVGTSGKIIVKSVATEAEALNNAIKDYLANHSYTINEHFDTWVFEVAA